MDKRKYGFIYITTNNINNKKYIGQKKYVNGWEKYLGSGIVIKSAIKKYGRENFSREIIEECNSIEELNKREIYWINFYDAVCRSDFYNIAYGGDGGNTIAGYTYEQKKGLSQKLSKLRRGKINIGENNGNSRKIILLNTMEIFNTINIASLKYGISKDAIQQCCSQSFSKTKTAGILEGTSERMVWAYYEEGKDYAYTKFVRNTDVFRLKRKAVYCITTNEIFSMAKEAGDKYNINPTSICSCCNGKLLSAGKHPVTKEKMTWKFVDKDGNVIKDKTQLEVLN